MKLKGTMTIELVDEASGEAEAIHEENMVTDAVDNILGSNLLGMYFDSGTSSKNITVNSQLLPICPNTLGGILLFPDTLEERKRWLLSNAIECDFEKEEIWSVGCSNTNVITISRSRLPMVSLCVNEKLNDSSVQELEGWEIEPSVFGFKKNVYYYGFFLNGNDGYWYGFCNSANSSGNASVKWIRIDRTDFSYTEGTWTLTNVQLPTMGYRDTNYELYKTWTRACIRGGYLYTFNYGYTGAYKADVR